MILPIALRRNAEIFTFAALRLCGFALKPLRDV
jgi:hypothetical protein